MSEEAAQREARANEMCLNCGSSRWKHHTFAGIGTLCPGNRGAARFPDKKPSPDLVTVPRAELEEIRDAMRDTEANLAEALSSALEITLHSAYRFPSVTRASEALAKLEDYLKGQP